jgi:hypothetical protein
LNSSYETDGLTKSHFRGSLKESTVDRESQKGQPETRSANMFFGNELQSSRDARPSQRKIGFPSTVSGSCTAADLNSISSTRIAGVMIDAA